MESYKELKEKKVNVPTKNKNCIVFQKKRELIKCIAIFHLFVEKIILNHISINESNDLENR